MVELVRIGHTLKPHGKEGLIRLRVEDDFVEDLSSANALFIDLDGSKVPFLINDLQFKNHILVKLDEVEDPQNASDYSSRAIFIESKFVSEKEENLEASVEDLLAFKVYNADKEYIGAISNIIQNPHQILIEINTPEKAFLMPFHPDLVLDLDPAAGSLEMEIPEGIMDI